jgi:O-antigen ligase
MLTNLTGTFKNSTPLGFIFSVLGLFLPIIPIFNARALVPFIAICAVSALVVASKDKSHRLHFNTDRWILLFIFGYVLVASTLGLEFEYAKTGMRSIFKLIGIILIGLALITVQKRLSSDDITLVATTMFVGFIFALTWLLIDGLTGGFVSQLVFKYGLNHYSGLFWLKAASSILVLVSLLVGIYLVGLRAYALATLFVFSAAFAAYSIQSLTASFGIVVSLCCGCFYQALGRIRKVVVSVFIIIAFLLPIWISTSGIAPEDIGPHLDKHQSSSFSIVYRAYIWDFTVDHISQKPILGWGIGASKRIGTDEAGVIVDPIFGRFGEFIPLHPHNSILQIWLEFGLVGAFFACALIIRAVYIFYQKNESTIVRIWSFSFLTILMCFFNFNYSISSSWWMASIMAFVAILAAFTRSHLPPLNNPSDLKN